MPIHIHLIINNITFIIRIRTKQALHLVLSVSIIYVDMRNIRKNTKCLMVNQKYFFQQKHHLEFDFHQLLQTLIG